MSKSKCQITDKKQQVTIYEHETYALEIHGHETTGVNFKVQSWESPENRKNEL